MLPRSQKRERQRRSTRDYSIWLNSTFRMRPRALVEAGDHSIYCTSRQHPRLGARRGKGQYWATWALLDSRLGLILDPLGTGKKPEALSISRCWLSPICPPGQFALSTISWRRVVNILFVDEMEEGILTGRISRVGEW